MMRTAWRIVQIRHAKTAFSGEGARLYPGRWNPRGVPMVYAAESLSLAALEMLVHWDDARMLDRYVCLPVRFDDRLCEHLNPRCLPEGWDRYPAIEATRRLGGEWIKRAATPVLAVPSAVVPSEVIYLLNPLHPEFRHLKTGPARPFRFDPRFFPPRNEN